MEKQEHGRIEKREVTIASAFWYENAHEWTGVITAASFLGEVGDPLRFQNVPTMPGIILLRTVRVKARVERVFPVRVRKAMRHGCWCI